MTIELKVFPLQRDLTTPFVIRSPFDPNRLHPTLNVYRPHKGADIRATVGTPLLAVDTGRVLVAKRTVDSGAGLYVDVQHDGYRVRYLHMNEIASDVITGASVEPGQVLGSVGNTGIDTNTGRPISTAPHLHFELYDARNVAINPEIYLRNAQAKSITQYSSPSQGGSSTTPASSIPEVSNTVASSQYVGSGTGTSPYIATLDSFHPNIQYELTKRRLGSETIHAHMPFVKLTALLKVSGKNVTDKSSDSLDEYCPSLGVHDQPEVSFDDIYLPKENKSIVGYATRMGTNGPQRIPIVVEDEAYDAPSIPMPGIVSMTSERSTAGPMGVRGGLYRANMKIMAHSVGQLNVLMKYFLRPATKVVLEIGRISSSPNEPSVADIESKDLFFNWKRPLDAIKTDLEEIAMFRGDQKGLITKYIYNNFGNYELFVGFISDFKLKYGPKNTYEIDLSMQSLQQFEVPLKNTGVRSLCRTNAIDDDSKAVDVDEYFSPGSNWKRNSISKLMSTVESTEQTDMTQWKPHVIKMRGTGTDNPTAGGYLVSWRFFIDVILGDEKYGLLSIFDLTNSDERSTLEFMRKAMPSKFAPDKLNGAANSVTDSQVSWHSSLRSTDPDVMVIYNPQAQQLPRVEQSISEANTRGIFTDELSNSVWSSIIRKNADISPFFETSKGSGVSSLYTGVWINTNAIMNAFDNSDTISTALAKLLSAMNSATEGVWNLQLLSTDNGIHVIDMGLSKPNTQPTIQTEDVLMNASLDRREEELRLLQGETPNTPKYIYKFNRKLKTFNGTDETMGSELLNINIQSGLPHVVAVQALGGVGGLGQRGTLTAINVDELKMLSLFDTTPTCGDSEVEPRSSVPSSDQEIITDLDAMNIAREAFNNAKTVVDETEVDAYVRTAIANNKIKPENIRMAHAITRDRINYQINVLNEEYAQRNGGLISLVKTYANTFGRALEMVEWNKAAMLKEIEHTATDEGQKLVQISPRHWWT